MYVIENATPTTYLLVENGSTTLTDVRIEIQLPEWLVAFNSGMVPSLPGKLDISTAGHSNQPHIIGGRNSDHVDYYDGQFLKIAEYRNLTVDIERLKKSRPFDDLREDSFMVLALPGAPVGSHSITAKIICEEYDPPLESQLEIEVL